LPKHAARIRGLLRLDISKAIVSVGT